MSHIENNLPQGERILLRPKLHWILLVRGIFTLIPAAFFYSPEKFEYFIKYLLVNTASIEKVKTLLYNITSLQIHWESFIVLITLVAGVLFTIVGLYRIITISIYITNNRIIKEVGLFSKDTAEVDVYLIDNVEVEQSSAGAYLHYGHVVVYSEMGSIILPFIKRPGKTRNAIISIIKKQIDSAATSME